MLGAYAVTFPTAKIKTLVFMIVVFIADLPITDSICLLNPKSGRLAEVAAGSAILAHRRVPAARGSNGKYPVSSLTGMVTLSRRLCPVACD